MKSSQESYMGMLRAFNGFMGECGVLVVVLAGLVGLAVGILRGLLRSDI